MQSCAQATRDDAQQICNRLDKQHVSIAWQIIWQSAGSAAAPHHRPEGMSSWCRAAVAQQSSADRSLSCWEEPVLRRSQLPEVAPYAVIACQESCIRSAQEQTPCQQQASLEAMRTPSCISALCPGACYTCSPFCLSLTCLQ